MTSEVVTLGVVCADVMARPVESFPDRGKLTLIPDLEIHLGGLAAVTATVLSQLGARAAFIGKIGDDGFGEYVITTMRSRGVDTAHTHRMRGVRTSATVVLIDGVGERTFMHHVGANALMTEVDIDFDVIRQAKILHWGGPSICPGLDGAPMGRVMKRAKSLGLVTSMDTMYDGGGVWFPHIEHVLPHLDIVMSSLEEARMYTGKTTPEDIADFYLSFGPNTVVVKLGAEGVFAKNRNTSCHIPTHKVRVVDTTGAGDAACGGFLYGWLQHWDLERCARLANAVGALTVQVMGGGEAVSSLGQAMAIMENSHA